MTMSRSREREQMVREQIVARGVHDERVLAAMKKVERERFLPPEIQEAAYQDRPLPIGFGQTISQPYIVAFMLQEVHLATGKENVLEVGTGSGYQAALLGELAGNVVTIERHVPLADRARARLDELKYESVRVIIRDGTKGHERLGPYDAIICAAAGPDAPPAPLEQLANG